MKVKQIILFLAIVAPLIFFYILGGATIAFTKNSSLNNKQIIKICADALAQRPLMKGYLIPKLIFSQAELFNNRITVIINEGLGRLYAINEKIIDIPVLIKPNDKLKKELNEAMKAYGKKYSPNNLYILNWNGHEIKSRNYIVSNFASASAKKQGSVQPHIHIDDIIPVERQQIIVDLMRRLEQFPEIEAYLCAGSMLNPNGSRTILTINNTACPQAL